MVDKTGDRQDAATVTSEELRLGVGELINRVKYRGERITVTRRGKPVMALVPIEDLELLDNAQAADSDVKPDPDSLVHSRRIGQYGPGHMR